VNISLNGEAMVVPDNATVADVVSSLAHDEKGVAVALDREIIPKSEWHDVHLHEAARIEVLMAAAGG
jgi:sulfur carrier protein